MLRDRPLSQLVDYARPRGHIIHVVFIQHGGIRKSNEQTKERMVSMADCGTGAGVANADRTPTTFRQQNKKIDSRTELRNRQARAGDEKQSGSCQRCFGR